MGCLLELIFQCHVTDKVLFLMFQASMSLIALCERS